MRMCIVCACFHVRYQGSSLAFISYIHFFCVAKVDAPQQHDHHNHNHHHDDDLMIINTVNTPTSNGERRWDPPGRARPTERICLQTKCDIWLERKRCGPKPCGDGLATLRVTNTGAHMYIHNRSVAQPPLIQLSVANAVVTQLLNGQEPRVEWTRHLLWLGLALIRFGRKGRGLGATVGDVPAALAAKLPVSFHLVVNMLPNNPTIQHSQANTHTHS